MREIISKVQTMRKEAGFEVQDHISLYYIGNEKIAEIMKKNIDIIADEVLANVVSEGKHAGFGKEWNLNGENIKLVVEKIK